MKPLKRLPILLSLSVILLLGACTPQKHIVQRDRMPSSLGIHLVNNARIEPADWNYFTEATREYIDKFNYEAHKFNLYLSDDGKNSLIIDFQNNKYITGSDQALGVVVTIAGIITPFVMIGAGMPFWVAFWYVPRNKTQFTTSLSSDIDHKSTKILRVLQTRHKFESYEKQKEKQKVAISFLII